MVAKNGSRGRFERRRPDAAGRERDVHWCKSLRHGQSLRGPDSRPPEREGNSTADVRRVNLAQCEGSDPAAL
jgi:hypothetical protein